MNRIIISRTITALAIMFSALFFTARSHAQNSIPASQNAGAETMSPNPSYVVEASF